MKVGRLLTRLAEDIPPCRYKEGQADQQSRPQFIIDCPEAEAPV
jgi:hypothetical protein